jgi:hypothetical protein
MDQIKDEIAAQIKEIRNSYTTLVDTTGGTKSFGRNRSMILKSILKKRYIRLWNGLDWFKTEPNSRFLLR